MAEGGAVMEAEDKALLARLATRCADHLLANEEAAAYLREQGLRDPALWSSYRLGLGSETMLADLGRAERERMRALGLLSARGGRRNVLAGSGVAMATFDPREPEQPVGFVRITRVQNKHRFVTVPRGLGCTADVADAERLIVADAPLLALRLAQAGAVGVVLAEDPAVLPPLHDWLAARDVLLVATKAPRLAALHRAMGTVPHRRLTLPSKLAQTTGAMLAELGLAGDALAEEDPAPPIDERLLHELHAYAEGRLAAGEAAEALEVLEADLPELIAAYQVGYLPPDYRNVLGSRQRRALGGLRLGGALVMPATDESGAVVDLHMVHATLGGRSNDGCFDEPRGLVGAGVVAVADQVIVTDTFRWLARLMRQGYRDVLLVRGPADVRRNAPRIAAAGIRQATIRVRRHAEAIAETFRAAGIFVAVEREPVTGDDSVQWPTRVVAPPGPAAQPAGPRMADSVPPVAEASAAEGGEAKEAEAAPPLLLVEFNADHDVAIFQAGPVRYAVELAEPDQPRRQVVVRRGRAAHQDRFALNVRAQCERFAAGATRRVDLPRERILGHLHEAWRQVREHEEALDDVPVVVLDEADQATAEELLRDPRLLERITDDLSALGWAGEDRAKGLLYLTAVSRLLPRPLWSVYRATAGAAPWRSLGMIAALLPSEACLVFHRLTETVLRQTDGRSLRHKLLLVDRAETLRPEGAIALRALREWGSVGWRQVLATGAEALHGRTAGLIGEAKGPVAVLAAAAGDLDRRCRDCFVPVTVDESPEQTARVLAAQRASHGRAAAGAEEVRAIAERHHALQRLLRPAAVVIPFAERIDFPMTSVRHRDEHEAFLTLIEASALLHQFQREGDADGAILAEEADFHHARALAGDLLGGVGDGLSRRARHLLQRLFATGTTAFTLADLGGLVPDWTYYTYRATAEELVHMGHCTATGGGQGRKRRYELAVGQRAGGASLRAATDTTEGHSGDQPLRPFETFCGDSRGPSRVTRAS